MMREIHNAELSKQPLVPQRNEDEISMFLILHVPIVPDVHLPMWKPSAHLSMQLCANHLRWPIE